LRHASLTVWFVVGATVAASDLTFRTWGVVE
jgi:hypothetical protein